MTADTLATPTALPGEVAARLESLGQEDRERALRLLQVAERSCGGDVSVLVAVVDAVTS
ncbi:MAG: hypothetical protein KY457_07125 [Actinobacteria bacterium]|nr:hypothetical protein [Actinomycetota bacterium]